MKIVVLISTLLFSFFSSAQSLPDMIRCNHESSSFQLVLIIKNPQLPEGFTAIGLKNGSTVIFKVATQIYTDEKSLLSFIETPATATSKEAKLNLQTKVATLLNFHMQDLPDGSTFNCDF